MAKKASRPGRTLIVFTLAVLAMFAGLALNGVWSPKLGLDLQGGTRITLEASTETGEAITPEKLEEAAAIIDSRVNASGVAESEVSTQGARNIVVEVPGDVRKDLEDTVKQTAQLRFRLVAANAAGGLPGAGASDQPKNQPSDKASDKAKPGKQADRQDAPRKRSASRGVLEADRQSSEDPSPSPKPADEEAEAGPVEVPTNKSSVKEMLAWTRSPDPRWTARFQEFSCGQDADVVDDPAQPLLTCDEEGTKYLLSPAMIEGTQLADATYGIPQDQGQYVVNLDFEADATKTFAEVTRELNGTNEQFAIVLDALVLSAPVVTSPILDGNAQITGNFTSASARSLANSLKYGALPLKFDAPVVTAEGPTLAQEQLTAGLWAGGLGLLLVLVYCLLYYRGLGIVVFASLGIAGAITYAAVIFLSETAGFTLTLPGIAGLIVAVGITADSFIVYFERIRDELREGKSLRVAVEAGWVRARATCLAADAVSLLAAVVLFIFAIGVVKGFAFALGISTVIDLVVFFLFTKPMVTWLAKFPFFARGHKLSGLSADHVGIARIGSAVAAPRRTAGGLAR